MTCPLGFTACHGLAKRRPRSIQQHRRFFGMVAAAFQHWPDHFEFLPRDCEHLRKWLTAKAGYVHQVHVPVIGSIGETVDLVEVVAEASTREDDHVFVRQTGPDRITVYRPKSIAFHSMGPQEFGLLNDKVSEIIEKVIGVDGDTLLQRQKEVA